MYQHSTAIHTPRCLSPPQGLRLGACSLRLLNPTTCLRQAQSKEISYVLGMLLVHVSFYTKEEMRKLLIMNAPNKNIRDADKKKNPGRDLGFNTMLLQNNYRVKSRYLRSFACGEIRLKTMLFIKKCLSVTFFDF